MLPAEGEEVPHAARDRVRIVVLLLEVGEQVLLLAIKLGLRERGRADDLGDDAERRVEVASQDLELNVAALARRAAAEHRAEVAQRRFDLERRPFRGPEVDVRE